MLKITVSCTYRPCVVFYGGLTLDVLRRCAI